MATPNAERTALYRFYDASGQLLYIGISHDPDGRWESHKYWSRAWEPLASRRTLAWFPTRRAALTAEKAAIRSERPQFNQAHNYELAPPTHQDWPSLASIKRGKAAGLAKLIREEIASGRWLPGQRIPSREEMAEATGVGFGSAIAATVLLNRQNVLRLERGSGYFVSKP